MHHVAVESTKLWFCELFLADITRLSLVQAELCSGGLHLLRRDRKGDELQEKQHRLERSERCQKCCQAHPQALEPHERCLAQRLLHHCHSPPVQGLSNGAK